MVNPKATAAAADAEVAVRRDSMRFTRRGYPKHNKLLKVGGVTPTSTVAAIPATPSPESGSTKFGGCVELDTGLDVNAGADADFFGLFNQGTSVNLFSKKFELFKVRVYNSLLSVCLLMTTYRF